MRDNRFIIRHTMEETLAALLSCDASGRLEVEADLGHGYVATLVFEKKKTQEVM